jgi:DNA-binding NarL/FixJ family response regulator
MIRLLIADDHAVVRRGVLTLLEDETDIEPVGEATDGDEALTLAAQLQPDVLLLDITMPRLSGLEVARQLAGVQSPVRVLMFSMHHNPDYILTSALHRAAGYVLKDADPDELLRAIRAVAGGSLYYPPPASAVIVRHWLATQPAPYPTEPAATEEALRTGSVWNRITAREAEVLTCLTEGLSSQRIAHRLGISPHTVANQRASLIRKAGVQNTAELISLALRDKR